jgi:hypothetical protein
MADEKQMEMFFDEDLALAEFPVFLKNADGQREGFVLIEMMGKARDAYMNDLAKRMKYVNGQPSGVQNFTGFTAGVVSRGLHRAELSEGKITNPDTGEDSIRVTIDDVGDKVGEKWIQENVSSRIQKKLFDKLMEMSGLTDRAEELAKND